MSLKGVGEGKLKMDDQRAGSREVVAFERVEAESGTEKPLRPVERQQFLEGAG
jgi:hypothetical protein